MDQREHQREVALMAIAALAVTMFGCVMIAYYSQVAYGDWRVGIVMIILWLLRAT